MASTSTSTLIPVEQYLRTHYRPDRDYVDGVILERNAGENNHAYWQRAILLYLCEREKQLGIYVIQEQRVQVSPTRFRVPDICILVGGRPSEPVFTSPPFVCVEILSPEDRISRMQERIDDYLAFGVSYCWVIDPKTRRAWVHTPAGISEVKDGVLRTRKEADAPEIVVPLAELFD